MTGPRLIRLAPSAALKEKRLGALLAKRGEGREVGKVEAWIQEQVQDAQLLGSLELAGFSSSWDDIKASRTDGRGPDPVTRLRRAQAAALRAPSLSIDVLLTWCAEATGGEAAFRQGPREREGGPPASPAEFIRTRLESLFHWLSVDSGRELAAVPRAALALARLVEILPFDDANGRVSRLVASHLITRAGARPPILVGGDRARFEQCLSAAFQLFMEPLVALLEEASERSLDVALQTLESDEAF